MAEIKKITELFEDYFLETLKKITLRNRTYNSAETSEGFGFNRWVTALELRTALGMSKESFYYHVDKTVKKGLVEVGPKKRKSHFYSILHLVDHVKTDKNFISKAFVHIKEPNIGQVIDEIGRINTRVKEVSNEVAEWQHYVNSGIREGEELMQHKKYVQSKCDHRFESIVGTSDKKCKICDKIIFGV